MIVSASVKGAKLDKSFPDLAIVSANPLIITADSGAPGLCCISVAYPSIIVCNVRLLVASPVFVAIF